MSMRWSPGARAAYRAIQSRATGYEGEYLPYRELVSALVVDTLPGDSLLGEVLRDPSMWTGSPATKLTPRPTPLDQLWRGYTTSPANFVNLTFQIEEIAFKDGSHTVGERHIAQLLASAKDVQFLELKAAEVLARVKELELGSDFAGLLRWDGLIDTNVILQYKDLWTIDWRAVVNRPETMIVVTLWVSAALLSEIDDQQYYSRNQRVARKARSFARWLKTQLKGAAEVENGIIFNSICLRFLTMPMADIPPDSRHLEAAFALRDRGLKPTIVTHDVLFRLRAIQAGFPVLDLPDELLEEKEPPTS